MSRLDPADITKRLADIRRQLEEFKTPQLAGGESLKLYINGTDLPYLNGQALYVGPGYSALEVYFDADEAPFGAYLAELSWKVYLNSVSPANEIEAGDPNYPLIYPLATGLPQSTWPFGSTDIIWTFDLFPTLFSAHTLIFEFFVQSSVAGRVRDPV